MADLIVETANNFGPLSVEIVAVGGDGREQSPVLLSSAQPKARIQGLGPGDYAVIGTRPTGERLVERVRLTSPETLVVFATKGRSPHEFLGAAASRGLVPSVPLNSPHQEGSSIRDMPKFGLEKIFGAAGIAGRALEALSASSVSTGFHDLFADAGRSAGHINLAALMPRWLVLHQWIWSGGRWQSADQQFRIELRPDYLQLFLDPLAPSDIRAYALLDEAGFGPVVIAPIFRLGLNITFLADGLRAEDAAERVTNPSAVRVPVAVAVPADPTLADLLSGLASGSLPGAEQLWVQSAQQSFGGVQVALDALLEKLADPAAAVLGAHFLSRFAPDRAPVRWLENLCRILPGVADPALLLAWRLIAEGSSEGRPTSRHNIWDLLLDATERPCTLFARTRALLTQGLRLYAPNSKEATARLRVPDSPGDFLNFAAEASGLEAFWGSGPQHPGRQRPRQGAGSGIQIQLEQGRFSTPAV